MLLGMGNVDVEPCVSLPGDRRRMFNSLPASRYASSPIRPRDAVNEMKSNPVSAYCVPSSDIQHLPVSPRFVFISFAGLLIPHIGGVG